MNAYYTPAPLPLKNRLSTIRNTPPLPIGLLILFNCFFVNLHAFQKKQDLPAALKKQEQPAHITELPTDKVTLREIGSLPASVKEASGLEITAGNHLWTHNDGGVPVLYCVDTAGTLIRTVYLNHKNNGWEDLAQDDRGNLYVGNFGNNKNDKQKLRIFVVPNPDTIQSKVFTGGSVITYSYRDQKAFPPSIAERNFDVDAMVALGDSLYLFTKNRTNPFTGYTKVYSLPQNPGEYQASAVDSIFLGKGPVMKFWITGADLSPDKKTLALLSHDCIWFIRNFQGSKFSSGKMFKLDLKHFSHKAGICFLTNDLLYIVDELELDIVGGKLYTLDLTPVKNLLR